MRWLGSVGVGRLEGRLSVIRLATRFRSSGEIGRVSGVSTVVVTALAGVGRVGSLTV